jgi:Hypothetical glycosyl hydrolase 6/Beta-galactosidase trimerisation domain
MKDWNDNKICRIMTGWPLSDLDQIADKKFYTQQCQLVDFNLNASRLVGEIAEAGAEAFCFHIKSHSGNVWFNSKIGKKFSALGDRDLVQEITEECRKKDIAAIGMFQIVCDQRAHDEHPEWRQINSEGNACDVSPRVCFNNPECRTYNLSLLSEIVGKYDLKAIIIDELDFNGRYGGGQMCYCKHCQELFFQRFNAVMPVDEDWDSQLWKDFISFRFDSLTKFIRDVRNTIKQENPKTLLSIISYSGIPLTWRRLQPIEQFAEYIDYFSLDTQGELSTSLYCRLFRAYSKEKAELISGTAPLLSHSMAEPAMQENESALLLEEAMTTIANNLSWNVDICYKPLPTDRALDASTLDYYSKVASEVKKREPWLTGKQQSMAEVALFYSENTKIYYGLNSPDLYIDEFMGYFNILINSNNIFDLIGTRHLTLEALEQYKLIVLPNAVCLDDYQVETFRQYVKNGGSIVASYKTSMCDEQGRTRNDYALSDVFGASFIADGPGGDYILKAGNLKQLDYGFFRQKLNDVPSVLPTATVKLKNNSADLIGELFYRQESANNHIPGFTKSYCPVNPPYGLAAINKFGKGKAVLLGAKFGMLYHKTALQIARKVIVNALDATIGNNANIKIKAPECIEVTAFMQDKKRLIIHLTNRQTGPERVEYGSLLYPNCYEAREILPVHSVEVEFRNLDSDKITRSYMAPKIQDIELKSVKDRRLIAKIPEIKHHSMLVIEMQ